MAKRIIILDRAGGRFRYALWAAVPAARQAFYANPTATSAWKGASGAEVLAIQNGEVVERVDTQAIDGTLAQSRTNLEAEWTRFQAEINSVNPWQRYGSFWDDTSTWTAAGAT